MIDGSLQSGEFAIQDLTFVNLNIVCPKEGKGVCLCLQRHDTKCLVCLKASYFQK